MFTRHRLSPANKLDCAHAMGTDAFSRIMIPRLPLRLRSGLRQRRDFGSGLRRPLGASTFCCHHRPIRLLRGAQSLRAGSGCLPRTQADESSSRDGSSHPKIAKSAILGWGTRRCRAFLATELLRFQHSELPAVCGEAALCSSQSGAGWFVAGGPHLHQSYKLSRREFIFNLGMPRLSRCSGGVVGDVAAV